MMEDIYYTYRRRVEDAVLSPPGDTAVDLRQAILEGGTLPNSISHFVDKVREHAAQIDDNDVSELKRQGLSDDAIFEIAACAAIGAARGWFESMLLKLNIDIHAPRKPK
jgi:hypothetical protein